MDAVHIKIIGIGKQGAALLSHPQMDSRLMDICYILQRGKNRVDTSLRKHYIRIGRRASGYLLSRQFQRLLDGTQVVLVVSGSSPQDIRYAKTLCKVVRQQGALSIVFVGMEAASGQNSTIEHVCHPSDSCIVITKNRYQTDLIIQGIRAVYELLFTPMYINVDYADLCTVMKKQKHAFINVGHGYGENRCRDAVQKAVHADHMEHKLSELSLAIVHIRGDAALTLREVQYIVQLLQEENGKDMDIIFGMVIDETLHDEVIVTILAAGNEA